MTQVVFYRRSEEIRPPGATGIIVPYHVFETNPDNVEESLKRCKRDDPDITSIHVWRTLKRNDWSHQSRNASLPRGGVASIIDEYLAEDPYMTTRKIHHALSKDPRIKKDSDAFVAVGSRKRIHFRCLAATVSRLRGRY